MSVSGYFFFFKTGRTSPARRLSQYYHVLHFDKYTTKLSLPSFNENQLMSLCFLSSYFYFLFGKYKIEIPTKESWKRSVERLIYKENNAEEIIYKNRK